jgi:hypothetical protein
VYCAVASAPIPAATVPKKVRRVRPLAPLEFVLFGIHALTVKNSA